VQASLTPANKKSRCVGKLAIFISSDHCPGDLPENNSIIK